MVIEGNLNKEVAVGAARRPDRRQLPEATSLITASVISLRCH